MTELVNYQKNELHHDSMKHRIDKLTSPHQENFLTISTCLTYTSNVIPKC